MDLRSHLLALVAPTTVGDELAPGARLVRASTELGLRLTFEVRGATVHVELAPIEDVDRFAARTERLAVSYRSGGAEQVEAALGMKLCRAVAQRVGQREAAVLSSIAKEKRDAPRIREVEVTQLLEPADGFDTLSPYVGCLIGCRFCYAQSRLASTRRLLGLADVPWGSYVDVRINAPAVLATELAARPDPHRPIKLCPIVSDPYQAIERQRRLTRACLEVLRDAEPSPPVMLLTRSAHVLDDVALLASLERVFVAFSIPTIDDAVRQHFEPRGAPIDERLEALRALRDAGVSTCAVVQPILPGSIDALAEALAEVVGAVSIDVLRGEEGAAADFDAHTESREDAWQRARADQLREALHARGVDLFEGEVPPALRAGAR